MKIAVLTTTYRKLDGSTYGHLKRALESVKNQTHKEYKLFLMGDDYTDNNELLELSRIIDPAKIYVENLPVSVERIKYSGYDLWTCGGVNASNTGIKAALSDGYDYICHLDHDDLFFKNHLQLISECIDKTGVNFVATRCGKYPPIETTEFYNKYRPVQSRLYGVSACTNYRYFNIFLRNMKEETGKAYPVDADLWRRINKLMEDKDEYGVFINQTTCEKTGGADPILKPEIVK